MHQILVDLTFSTEKRFLNVQFKLFWIWTCHFIHSIFSSLYMNCIHVLWYLAWKSLIWIWLTYSEITLWISQIFSQVHFFFEIKNNRFKANIKPWGLQNKFTGRCVPLFSLSRHLQWTHFATNLWIRSNLLNMMSGRVLTLARNGRNDWKSISDTFRQLWYYSKFICLNRIKWERKLNKPWLHIVSFTIVFFYTLHLLIVWCPWLRSHQKIFSDFLIALFIIPPANKVWGVYSDPYVRPFVFVCPSVPPNL